MLGGLLVLWTSSSVLETLVTPGVQVERLYRTVYLTIDQPFRWLSYLVPDYRRRYRFMVFQAPLTLVVGLFSWLLAYLVGYALLLWPSTRDAASALRESGSSLFTLGFAYSRSGGPTAVDFLASATGLIVVALQIAYLPTLYTAFNRRETEVTLMGVRGGLPSWGPELLARTRTVVAKREEEDRLRDALRREDQRRLLERYSQMEQAGGETLGWDQVMDDLLNQALGYHATIRQPCPMMDPLPDLRP